MLRVFAYAATGLLALNSLFAVAADSALTVTSPSGKEGWAIGSGHFVTWTTTPPATTSVKIELGRANGSGWTELGTVAANVGKFLWKVSGEVSEDAVLRLSAGAVATTSKPFQIIPSQEVPEYQWENVTMTAAWAPRDGGGALVYNDRMWLLGGWNPAPNQRMYFPRICNNEVWSSADGVEWTLVKPNTFLDSKFDPTSDWEGRHTAGYVVHQGKMWIVGGDVNQGHYHFDVWNSTDGREWKFVNAGKPVPWGPRALHYTVAFKDKIWVIGGQTVPPFAPSEEKFYRDIWTSSDGVEWTKLEPKEPFFAQRGMIGGGAVLNGRLWVLGGGTYDTPKIRSREFRNDVWSTEDGVHWTQHVAEAPWHPRQYHDVATYDGRLWVMEGYHVNGGNRKDCWYSKDGVNWYEVANVPWKPRHAASVYVFKDALWMVSGNNMEKDVWRLTRKPAAR